MRKMVVRAGSSPVSCVATSVSSPFKPKIFQLGLLRVPCGSRPSDTHWLSNSPAVKAHGFFDRAVISNRKFQNGKNTFCATSVGHAQDSEVDSDALEETNLLIPSEESSSSSGLYVPFEGTDGKPGLLSFYNRPYGREDKLLTVYPQGNQNNLQWILGPAVLVQNYEDAGHIIGNLSSETMTLTEIACRCEQVATKLREEEFCEDMLCEKNMGKLEIGSPLEKEAERLYTRTIIKIFREELISSLCLVIEEIKCTETLRMFHLTEEGSRKTQTVSSQKTQTVKFDPSNLTLACSCGKFESVGILCVHALKVLNFMNIFEIPSRYLLKRWTKSAKDSMPVDTPSSGAAHDSFMGAFMRKALHVAHMSVNKKRKIIAMRFIDLAVEHIAKVLKTEEVVLALDDPDGKDDMDGIICEYALENNSIKRM